MLTRQALLQHGLSRGGCLGLASAGDGEATEVGFRADRSRRFSLGRTRSRHGRIARPRTWGSRGQRSEEHTSELQSLMRISYAVFCLKKKNTENTNKNTITSTKDQITHS